MLVHHKHDVCFLQVPVIITNQFEILLGFQSEQH
jgi:hypothetical protein